LTVAPDASGRRRALLADGALLTVAVVWGLNFVVIKDAIGATGPMTDLLWRHLTAALLLVAIMPRTVRQVRRVDWLYGAVLGLFLFVAFATQTIGLQGTTPGRSGLITSLDIVMVPFLYWLVARRSPGWIQVGGAVLATAGLGFLSLRGGLSMGEGDFPHTPLRPGLRRADHRHRLLRAAHPPRGAGAHAGGRRPRRCSSSSRRCHGARQRRFRLAGRPSSGRPPWVRSTDSSSRRGRSARRAPPTPP
jgi:EamA-like transporter family